MRNADAEKATDELTVSLEFQSLSSLNPPPQALRDSLNLALFSNVLAAPVHSTLSKRSIIPRPDLLSASSFALLSQAGISSIPNSVITGDIGVSPISASAITGFGLIYGTPMYAFWISERVPYHFIVGHSASGDDSASATQVTGGVYAADYSLATSTLLTQAVSDANAAYTFAMGVTSTDSVINVLTGELGGLTLAPGLYTFDTGVTASADFTLAGGPEDVWIFQIAGVFSVASGVNTILAASDIASGAPDASNVFFAVTGGATLGTTSHLEGIILSATTVIFETEASLHGRAFAGTAITLSMATVTAP
ncbi:hypothetical protein P7C70_g4246, partial [Phenoliferia sp. Uapishka_3]